MTDVEVSIVMPVGRVDEHLPKQLDSLSKQKTDLKWELVIGLNSAADQDRLSLEGLLENFDFDSRIVVAGEKRSAAYARNVAAKAANASVIAFCDADDICDEHWLQQIAAPVVADNSVATGGALEERLLGVKGQENWRPPATPDALPTFMGEPYLVSANMAMTGEKLEAAGGFDESLSRCEDIALSWKLMEAGARLIYVGSAIVHYRHRKGLRQLLSQHYKYGIGFSELLSRYQIPGEQANESSSILNKLKPNGAKVEHRSIIHYARRGAIAAGRIVGLVQQRIKK